MRLTLVISSLGFGGAERVMSIMANCWARRGEDVTLLTLSGEAGPWYPLDRRVKHQSLALAGDSGNVLAGLFRNVYRLPILQRAIRESRPEVVISFLDKTNVLTLLATRGLGVPVVVSERVDPSLYDIGTIWSQLRRWTYPLADALVCQTAGALRYFRSIVRGRVDIIPNPVLPAPEFDDGARRKPAGNSRVIVAMGRLMVQKGFDLLLEAFAAIACKHPQWSLTIVGEGPMSAKLRDRAEQLGISSAVTFSGLVANPFSVLRNADLFVLPSRFEGFPNALLEAMACGLPVVSFDCPSGPREIIRDGVDGILVPPGDGSALAKVLDRLMEDGAERERLAKRAPDVLDRFGLDKVMSKWNELVTQITDGNPGY